MNKLQTQKVIKEGLRQQETDIHDTDEIIKEPLGDDDIRFYLPNAPIMKYSELNKYKIIEQLLPKENTYAFLLYENSKNKGHWVVISRYKYLKSDKEDLIEFFDSYGEKIDEELNWNAEEQNRMLGQGHKILTELLKKTNKKVIYNPFKYQGDENNNINTCGRHCVFRIKNLLDCKRNLNQYYTFMKEIKVESGNTFDEIITHLIDKI
jgi:hypothetical protein